MSIEATATAPLNEMQLMLLKLFSRPMKPAELEAIRNMLLDFYDDLLQKEVNQAITKKGITRTDFDRILSNSQRTK